MKDWHIKDNKIKCYNLYNKLYPYKANDQIIAREISRIQQKECCSVLKATEIYKAELKSELEAKK